MHIKKPKRVCKQCSKHYTKNKKFSKTQWSHSRYCSPYCAGLSKRIKDQYKNKDERHRRKKGMLKQHTPEWLELIRSTTKDAMLKPDINFKLRQPRLPLTDEHKAKISNKLVGRMPVNLKYMNSGSYQNVKRGDYEINGQTMYFRSRWEANYALYLEFLVEQKQLKSWEYEADVFVFEEIKFGTRSYRPDFKIVNNDDTIEYHEVKGHMNGSSKTKLRRMIKYYPDVKLILIDGEIYRDILKKLSGIINFYTK